MDTQTPLSRGREAPGERSAPTRDLLIVAAVTGLAFLLSAALELREWLTEATRPLERYQVDELPFTFAVLALALTWFAWRRWRHAEQELRLRIQAQRELSDALAENRLLSQKYLMLQEEERRNLARELHDELGQCLNAIKLDAVAVRDLVHARQPEVEAAASSIIDLSGHVYDVVRGIMRRLRPVALDALGLHDAIGHLIGQWQRRHPAVDCRFDVSGDLAELGEVVNITVYRLVQECLTNITKHAHASAVTVSVQRTEAQTIQVTVRDDGRGMDLGTKRSGLGLVGLRERVEALNGRLSLSGASGRGLEVVAVLPVPARQGGPPSAGRSADRMDTPERETSGHEPSGGCVG
jgi:glucose-6-phosphate-specific signal transduction histidine kinase